MNGAGPARDSAEAVWLTMHIRCAVTAACQQCCILHHEYLPAWLLLMMTAASPHHHLHSTLEVGPIHMCVLGHDLSACCAMHLTVHESSVCSAAVIADPFSSAEHLAWQLSPDDLPAVSKRQLSPEQLITPISLSTLLGTLALHDSTLLLQGGHGEAQHLAATSLGSMCPSLWTAIWRASSRWTST